MPATSKAQQRLFGLAYAIKKGDMKKSDADAKAVEIADSMSLADLKKFAETDHKGLPDKVKESLLTEGKGYTEARKLIDTLRAKTYRKLNDDELWEFKKEMVDHLGGTLEEGISPSSMGGMGAVAFPSDTAGTADGSGDVPAGRGDAEEEYKKKKKKRDAEIEKQKNESVVHTSFANFVNEAKIKDAREDLGYVSFMKEMAEINAKDLQKAYQSAVNVLVNEKGMSEKEAVGFLNSPHGKYMAEYLIPGQDFGYYAFLDKLEEYYNERMLKKYAKDFKGLA